jgi:transcriptional regulator with XRE-family HTH domain
MRFEEKLRRQMLLKGFNQQRLARASSVSDSEISRILSGKSANPGLENALRLARALSVSLDFLADDAMDEDTSRAGDAAPSPVIGIEAEVLGLARDLGMRQARRVLETVTDLSYEIAIRRLLEMRPLIEVGDPPRASNQASIVAPDRRASSA